MNESKIVVRASPVAAAAPVRHCRVAGSRAAGAGYEDSLAALLRGRLCVVTLISLVPLAIFLGRNLLEADGRPDDPVRLALHAGVTVLHAGLALLVWGPVCLPLRALRLVELLLFGSLAAFFAWLQVNL